VMALEVAGRFSALVKNFGAWAATWLQLALGISGRYGALVGGFEAQGMVTLQ
jgi:hypothetical protein